MKEIHDSGLAGFGWGEYYEKRARIFEDPLVASEYITPEGKIEDGLVQAMAGFILDRLRPGPAHRILDVGCACGVMLGNLIEAGMTGKQIVGIDVSPGMIEKARSSLPGVNFKVMEAANIGELGRFDRILLWGVTHYLDRRDYALTVIGELIRALEPGGRALIGWVPESRKKEQYIAWRRALPRIDNSVRIERNDSLQWLWFDREEFQRLETDYPVKVRFFEHRDFPGAVKDFFFSALIEVS